MWAATWCTTCTLKSRWSTCPGCARGTWRASPTTIPRPGDALAPHPRPARCPGPRLRRGRALLPPVAEREGRSRRTHLRAQGGVAVLRGVPLVPRLPAGGDGLGGAGGGPRGAGRLRGLHVAARRGGAVPA